MPKTKNLYALLIGIDRYEPTSAINPLFGCANDIQTMKEYLEERISKDVNREIKTLINEKATYDAIVDGFKNHLGKAKSEQDTVLFYFAGHGSQEPAPEVFWYLEPDRKNETLVCYDSRTPEGKDLADKELAYLIGELAKHNPHIVAILDCCHSGSGTRDPFQLAKERRTPESTKLRSLDSYVFPKSQLDFPRGKHIVLSACRDYQTSKEYKDDDNNNRGVFSYFLMRALKLSNGNVSYRDIFQETNALIRGNISDQSPQMEGEESDLPFLGVGTVAERQQYFTASYSQDLGWIIDGGAVHGVAVPMQGQFTRLALFPFRDSEGNPSDLTQLANAVEQVNVTEVRPSYSKLQPPSLDRAKSYKAVVISQPIAPMMVSLEGDEKGVSLVRYAIQIAGVGQTPSLYVKEAPETEEAQFRVIAQQGEYIIARRVDARPLVEQVQGYTPQNAAKVIKNLEHIDRWRKVVDLSREANSSIPFDAVKLTIIHGEKDEEMQGADIRLEYRYDSSKKEWVNPTFRVKLKNTTKRKFYCSLVNLTEQFGIFSMLSEAVLLKEGEEVFVVSNGDPILEGYVLDKLWEQGITEYNDIFKLIVCTTDFNPKLLEQDDLGIPLQLLEQDDLGIPLPSTRQIPVISLDILLDRLITRHVRSQKSPDDWLTKAVTLTIVRPKESVSVNAQTEADLGSGILIKPHSSFTAKARLTTIPQSTRDIGDRVLPAILQTDYEIVRPFEFTTTRGSDPGLSGLELSDLTSKAIASVTPETPLQLTVVGASLARDEQLLAIGVVGKTDRNDPCDSQFFLPVGLGQNKNGNVEISLERLPEPMYERERSPIGSVRIFFQKVISKRLKLDFPYPLLSAVTFQPDGTVNPYDSVEVSVKERVAKASCIVLFIHGIIGDTESMVPSMQQAKIEVNGHLLPLLSPNVYDLVLAFDYENLNTSIIENAQALKQKLEAVGLDKDHSKTLHIVAHSMGGLVSRWFIEQEGGKEIVNHLIMFGTPNNGSPWPNVVDFALPLLTVGLNGLAAVAWPVSAIGALMHLAGAATVGAESQMTTALKEMQEKSTFLSTLFSSEPPGIFYTVIAGNTSLIQPQNPEFQRQIEDLLKRVGQFVVEFPFMGVANDIAVKVDSITYLPNRSPKPNTIQIACDHLTYFIHPAGLAALSEAVRQALQLGSDSLIAPPLRNDPESIVLEAVPQPQTSA